MAKEMCFWCRTSVPEKHCRNPKCSCGCYLQCQHGAELVEWRAKGLNQRTFPSCRNKAYEYYPKAFYCKMHIKVHRKNLIKKIGGQKVFEWLIESENTDFDMRNILETRMLRIAKHLEDSIKTIEKM